MALIYSVIESKHEELRRFYQGKDLSRFTEREVLSTYRSGKHYFQRSHDLALSDDQGYFVYDDVVMKRKIFIGKKDVGLSLPFHQEFDIEGLFHLIIKSNNHEDFDRMDEPRRQWWIDNMQYVALQMLDTTGNIVLFCNNGRTRSPMYLVAYLVIMYTMSVSNAMDFVGQLLLEQRGLQLDRFKSLVPIVEIISRR